MRCRQSQSHIRDKYILQKVIFGKSALTYRTATSIYIIFRQFKLLWIRDKDTLAISSAECINEALVVARVTVFTHSGLENENRSISVVQIVKTSAIVLKYIIILLI